jgi:CheY-like chemotaxis protein
MKTLLIDDDCFALLLLQQQLLHVGNGTATLCSRARDAVDRMAAAPEAFELVFCDLQMPDMDGVEFMRHLGRIGYRGALVLVSGEDGRMMQTARRLAQVHRIYLLGTLHKPVSIDRLRQVLACRASQVAVRVVPR